MSARGRSAEIRAAGGDADLRPALRFLTCGSVDDGKSTLIGRLLHEQGLIFDDQLLSLARDSKKHGSTGSEALDYALLLDGLEAEREQGITIDVAYRYFTTARRAFVVADTPGHEQYTRNMATGASNCDVAVLLVDARKGLLAQSRRHALIVRLLGIRRIALAVNKMDMVSHAQEVFGAITDAFEQFVEPLEFVEIVSVPLSARFGDNVSSKSERMRWYTGPHLLEYLETVEVDERRGGPFRLRVQWVNRPNLDFRGFAGTIAAGMARAGDEVIALPSARSSRIRSIFGPQGEVESAEAGDAVTVTLQDEIDVARGDILAAARSRPQVADQFAAHLVWMGSEPLLPGRSYWIKINHTTLPATITELKHQIDIDTHAHLAAKTLALNEIGVCNLSLSRPVAFDSYNENRTTGAFILIDRVSNETVAAGMIDFALRRATNIHHQDITVTKADRSRLMHHKPAVLWFTGLPGAGKSTIANLVEASLHARGVHTILLDGDNVRHGLNKDLGFTPVDRVENIRRIGETAKLMAEAGLVVLCAFVSPFRAERDMVRELLPDSEFIEVFVDAPLEVCIQRDPKGLYARALAGQIANFTGVGQEYEPPNTPEVHLRASAEPAIALAEQVVTALLTRIF